MDMHPYTQDKDMIRYNKKLEDMRSLLKRLKSYNGNIDNYLDEFAELKNYLIDLGTNKLGMMYEEVNKDISRVRNEVNREQTSESKPFSSSSSSSREDHLKR